MKKVLKIILVLLVLISFDFLFVNGQMLNYTETFDNINLSTTFDFSDLNQVNEAYTSSTLWYGQTSFVDSDIGRIYFFTEFNQFLDRNCNFNEYYPSGNTQIKCNFIRNATGQAWLGGTFGMLYTFDDTISLTNETIIRLYVNSTTESESDYALAFYNNSDGDIFSITKELYTDTYSGYDSFEEFTQQAMYNRYRFNYVSDNQYQFAYNISYFRNIKHLVLFFTVMSTTDYEIFIDKFEILNVLNSSNSLPEFNITLNPSITCINSTEPNSYSIINLTWETYDRENDGLWYGFQETTNKNYNRSIDYNNPLGNCNLFGICEDIPDYDFLDNVYYPYSNTCGINENIDLNFSDFTISYLSSVDKYTLLLHNSCSGSDKQYYYRFDYPIIDMYYYTEIREFNNQGESFNISFWNSDFEETNRFKFEINNNRLLVYDYNLTDMNLIGNFSNPTNLEFAVNEYRNSTSGKIAVFNVVDGVLDYDRNIDYDSLTYVSINVGSNSSTRINQVKFYYSGIFEQINFFNQYPDYIIADEKGLFYYNFYISDNYHVNLNEYNKKTISFSVVECSNLIQPIKDEQITSGFTAFKKLNFKVCSSSSKIINNLSNNADINLCNMEKLLYIVLGFLIGIAVAFLFGLNMGATFGYIAFSLVNIAWGIMGSFMFYFEPSIKVMYGLIGVSFIGVFLIFLLGGGGNNG